MLFRSDWFAYNLKDGNDDLSLRPFLYLLQKSKEVAIGDEQYLQYAEKSKTILGAKYFAGFQAMEHIGKEYYEELEKEKGNEGLILLRDFLRNPNSNIQRKGTYTFYEFQQLIAAFIREKKEDLKKIELDNSQNIIIFLKNNGIIRERREKGGERTYYEIPFLYKYYLLFDNA